MYRSDNTNGMIPRLSPALLAIVDHGIRIRRLFQWNFNFLNVGCLLWDFMEDCRYIVFESQNPRYDRGRFVSDLLRSYHAHKVQQKEEREEAAMRNKERRKLIEERKLHGSATSSLPPESDRDLISFLQESKISLNLDDTSSASTSISQLFKDSKSAENFYTECLNDHGGIVVNGGLNTDPARNSGGVVIGSEADFADAALTDADSGKTTSDNIDAKFTVPAQCSEQRQRFDGLKEQIEELISKVAEYKERQRLLKKLEFSENSDEALTSTIMIDEKLEKLKREEAAAAANKLKEKKRFERMGYLDQTVFDYYSEDFTTFPDEIFKRSLMEDAAAKQGEDKPVINTYHSDQAGLLDSFAEDADSHALAKRLVSSASESPDSLRQKKGRTLVYPNDWIDGVFVNFVEIGVFQARLAYHVLRMCPFLHYIGVDPYEFENEDFEFQGLFTDDVKQAEEGDESNANAEDIDGAVEKFDFTQGMREAQEGARQKVSMFADRAQLLEMPSTKAVHHVRY